MSLSSNGMLSRSDIARSARPCPATGFRREAISHGVQDLVRQRDAVTKRYRTECKPLSCNEMQPRSDIARSASPCLATRFRREATSHGVRDNRNPTQAPGVARSVGRKTPPDHSARKGATKNSRSSARIKVDVIFTDEQSVGMEESNIVMIHKW